METSDLVSLWHQECTLRSEATSIQREILRDNEERCQHEVEAMDAAVEREMARIELEHERIDNERLRGDNEHALEMADLEIEKLRLEAIRDGNVSGQRELDDLVNRLRVPWTVHARESRANALRVYLEVVLVVYGTYVFINICRQ